MVVSGTYRALLLSIVWLLQSAAAPQTCSNGMLDANESFVDCGGSCPPCSAGQPCSTPADCATQVCAFDFNVIDSNISYVVNETRQCQVFSCDDGVQNGLETDVDCGAASGCAQLCRVGYSCSSDADCDTNSTPGLACQAPPPGLVSNSSRKFCAFPTVEVSGVNVTIYSSILVAGVLRWSLPDAVDAGYGSCILTAIASMLGLAAPGSSAGAAVPDSAFPDVLYPGQPSQPIPPPRIRLSIRALMDAYPTTEYGSMAYPRQRNASVAFGFQLGAYTYNESANNGLSDLLLSTAPLGSNYGTGYGGNNSADWLFSYNWSSSTLVAGMRAVVGITVPVEEALPIYHRLKEMDSYSLPSSSGGGGFPSLYSVYLPTVDGLLMSWSVCQAAWTALASSTMLATAAASDTLLRDCEQFRASNGSTGTLPGWLPPESVAWLGLSSASVPLPSVISSALSSLPVSGLEQAMDDAGIDLTAAIVPGTTVNGSAVYVEAVFVADGNQVLSLINSSSNVSTLPPASVRIDQNPSHWIGRPITLGVPFPIQPKVSLMDRYYRRAACSSGWNVTAYLDGDDASSSTSAGAAVAPQLLGTAHLRLSSTSQVAEFTDLAIWSSAPSASSSGVVGVTLRFNVSCSSLATVVPLPAHSKVFDVAAPPTVAVTEVLSQPSDALASNPNVIAGSVSAVMIVVSATVIALVYYRKRFKTRMCACEAARASCAQRVARIRRLASALSSGNSSSSRPGAPGIASVAGPPSPVSTEDSLAMVSPAGSGFSASGAAAGNTAAVSMTGVGARAPVLPANATRGGAAATSKTVNSSVVSAQQGRQKQAARGAASATAGGGAAAYKAAMLKRSVSMGNTGRGATSAITSAKFSDGDGAGSPRSALVNIHAASSSSASVAGASGSTASLPLGLGSRSARSVRFDLHDATGTSSAAAQGEAKHAAEDDDDVDSGGGDRRLRARAGGAASVAAGVDLEAGRSRSKPLPISAGAYRSTSAAAVPAADAGKAPQLQASRANAATSAGPGQLESSGDAAAAASGPACAQPQVRLYRGRAKANKPSSSGIRAAAPR